MTLEPHEESDLDAFEARLRALQPRGPLHPSPLLDRSSVQVAARDTELGGKRSTRPNFYRTIGISAACGGLVGGLFGAACTLWLLRWSAADVPPQPRVLVETVIEADQSAIVVNAQRSTESLVDSEAVAKEPLASTDNSPPLLSWLNDPVALQPYTLGSYALRSNTLGVGTRFVSQLSSPRATGLDQQLAALESAAGDSSEFSYPPVEAEPLLPQRQWMRSLLSSPGQLF